MKEKEQEDYSVVIIKEGSFCEEPSF